MAIVPPRRLTPPPVPPGQAVSHPRGGEFGPNGSIVPPRVSPPGGGNRPRGLVSSRASANTTAAVSAPGGVVIGPPRYTPPTEPPPPPPRPPVTPPPPPNRTFQDPRRPTDDPRIADLLRALTGDKGADANSIARNAELQKLIERLMRGEGISTPDMSTDPAARAYAVAKQREAERMREAAAAQVGASGVSGDSELATRAAQIREATGESIAANNADLTNKRRTEALTTAITGANLQMTDLQRQDQARRAASGDRLALLQVLMAGDKTKQDAYEREKDRVATERARDLEFQRKQQEARYQEERSRALEQEREDKVKAEERKKFEDAWRARFGTAPPGAAGQGGGYARSPLAFG